MIPATQSNELLSLLRTTQPAIVELIDRGYDTWRAPPPMHLRERRFEPVEFTLPYRAFELFDWCENQGLRFIVSNVQLIFRGGWVRRIFDYRYTIRVFDVGHER